jgi:hypothetical protein
MELTVVAPVSVDTTVDGVSQRVNVHLMNATSSMAAGRRKRLEMVFVLKVEGFFS